MLGYTEATVARKAEKRNITPEAYMEQLVAKRANRGERRRKAKAERMTYLLAISTWTEQERKAQAKVRP
jgi:hypothetical protein